MQTGVLAPTAIGISHLAATYVSAKELRAIIDGLFPVYAKNPTADFLSGGPIHRWKGGHGITDVFSTTYHQGAAAGFDHAAHVVLTDFPTVAGVPLPFLSQHEFGGYPNLDWHWLNVNLWETSAGIFGIFDSSHDLIAALHGDMVMNLHALFVSSSKIAVEGVCAFWSHNPLLLFAAGEEALAVGVATWKTYAVYVSVGRILGSAIPAIALGFSLTCLLMRNRSHRERFTTSCANGLRSGIVSTCFAVSPIFGAGAACWAFAIAWGGFFANKHNKLLCENIATTEATYRLFFQDCLATLAGFSEFTQEAETWRCLEEGNCESAKLYAEYGIVNTFDALVEESNQPV